MDGNQTRGPATFEMEGVAAEVTSERGRQVLAFTGPDAVVRPFDGEFVDREHLVAHLSEKLRIPVEAGGLRGSMTRKGKYTRRSRTGDIVHTFGDPILDMITNDEGDLIVGGRRFAVGREELRDSRQRLGGLSTLDLAGLGDDFVRSHGPRAAMGEGDYVLLTRTSELTAFASKNPAQRDFFLTGDHLRFKAWKKKFAIYWSMGAEIETWGHDFDEARIDSRYLDTAFGQTCSVIKIDSDQDRNDDYVDEYEWGVGSPQPIRVESSCTARWKRQNFAGQVEAGPPCFEV